MIDVATVAGYRQVVMCQEVRDEIEAVIGPDASVRDMLLGMCDRRLLPTPWVNQVCASPQASMLHTHHGLQELEKMPTVWALLEMQRQPCEDP